jgi:trans-aconitate 2-methyltransferase
MRPYVEGMSETQKADLIANYDTRLERAYPREADGTILFPFKRVVLIVRRP